MIADLNIQKIVSVYECRTTQWRRDFFAPRNYDGVVFFTEGEIEYYFPDKTLRVKKGDFIFLPGNVPYSGKKLCETVGFFVIDFTSATCDEFEKNVQACTASAANYNATVEGFQKIVDVWKRQQIDMNFKIKAFLYSVLCNALSAPNQEKSVVSTSAILDYICENIGDPALSVKLLCEKFYISESQLRRNILKQTGAKPAEYILNLRINMAKNELTYTSLSIVDVSEKCGFASPYYFSNCFSKCVGVSPRQYRNDAIHKR